MENGALEQSPVLRLKSTPETRARGIRRMKEIIVEREVERRIEADKLIAELGRRPNARESILIEQIATQVVRSRHLVAGTTRLPRGGSAEAIAECTRLITRAISKLGLPEPPVAPPQAPTVTQDAPKPTTRALVGSGDG